MIIVPLYFLLILYGVFLLVFFTFFFINFFHIILTGTTTFKSFLVTCIVIAASALTFYGTWYYLQGINWTETLFTLNLGSITNLFQSGNGEYF